MDVVPVVMVLLVAVLVASILTRAMRQKMPLPLVQIGVGALVGMVPSLRVEFDPQVFFLLFLPPLLFLDGWRIPKADLFRDSRPILALSFGLVIFTIVGIACVLTVLVPSMPLAVAVAIAAVLSPTDPVAFTAVAARTPLPKRLLHILEGESLLNDATGLVFFRFAVAAAMTGSFSVVQGAATFVYLALGGVAVGYLVAKGIVMAKGWASRRFGEEPGVQTLISLLIPFVAYMTAESLHCSGILAAVAAGVTMGMAEFSGQALAATRLRRNAVWDTVQYALNGFIFVLLGGQFPAILAKALQGMGEFAEINIGWMLFYIVVVTVAMVALRFAWVWSMFQIAYFRQGIVRRADDRTDIRLMAVLSLAGVRGAITLAGVLTLPWFLSDGGLFPHRDVAILLACGVIVLSMVLATFVLPHVLKGMTALPDGSARVRAERVRRLTALAAIKAIEQAQHRMAEGRSDADLFNEAAVHVMAHYRLRISKNIREESAAMILKMEQIERELALVGLRAERAEIYRMARDKKVDELTARRLVSEVDLMEARL